MVGLTGHDRDDLDTGRSGSDHPDPLAGEVDRLVRPRTRRVDLTSKRLQTGKLRRRLRPRQVARRGYDEPCRVRRALVGRDRPGLRCLVPHHRAHRRRESELLTDIELVRDELQVGQDLRLSREALAPLPLTLDLVGEGVRVVHRLEVAPRTRIPIPIPRTTRTAGPIEALNPQPQLVAQLVHRVQAREARSDDDDIAVRLHHVPPALVS